MEAICKDVLEVRLGVGRKKISIPIRSNSVKVISRNDIVVQSEWDRGAFRLWTKGSAFCVELGVQK